VCCERKCTLSIVENNLSIDNVSLCALNTQIAILLEAADQEWILQKVVLMMGIFGGYRCDELCKVMNCYSYYWYVIIFNIQLLFHKIEFQLCVSESPCAKVRERKR
jgi:hypothetical protein